jgi:putative FmdB family regulatory protein
MPLFEFRCLECQKRFTFMVGVVAENSEPRCPACSSLNLKKLISRFVSGRSDDERMESIAEKMDSQDFDDPSTMRRFAREMGREIGAETGEDLSDEMEELIESEANGSSSSVGGDDGTIY